MIAHSYSGASKLCFRNCTSSSSTFASRDGRYQPIVVLDNGHKPLRHYSNSKGRKCIVFWDSCESTIAWQWLEACGCCAGQAVVQMARSIQNGMEYAIKFYVSRAVFDLEQGMYAQGGGAQAGDLAQFLPQVCIQIPQALLHICTLHCDPVSTSRGCVCTCVPSPCEPPTNRNKKE